MVTSEPKKFFRCQTANFALTYPKCTVLPQEAIKFYLNKFDDKIRHISVVQEFHKDGEPHLHVHLQFLKKYNCTADRTFDLPGKFHPNIEKVKSISSWQEYLCKEGTPHTWGDLKTAKVCLADEGKDERQQINKMILERPLTELIDEGSISIYSYVQLRNAKIAYAQDKQVVKSIYPRSCYWIWGEPGIGKSYWVRKNFPSAFTKPQNKWWDGYTNEDVVVLDDLDCSMLGHYLKIWGDNYSFNAEIKGASLTPSYTKMFITSNYFPEELFKVDNMLAKAILRRFRLVTIFRNEEDSHLVDYYTQETVTV